MTTALRYLLAITVDPMTEREARKALRTAGHPEEVWEVALDMGLLRPARGRGLWCSRVVAAELIG